MKLSPEDVRELVFDATERPTRRLERGGREFDSGKTKRHTIETRVVVARRTKPPGAGPEPSRLRIVAVSESRPGKSQDTNIYDRARVAAPSDAERTGDTAYWLPNDTATRSVGIRSL